MGDATLRRVTESCDFAWPWSTSNGLAVIAGAAGGGGGGGGAFCLEGLNVYGATGGGGGGGIGYEKGDIGTMGAIGFVLFVPLFTNREAG